MKLWFLDCKLLVAGMLVCENEGMSIDNTMTASIVKILCSRDGSSVLLLDQIGNRRHDSSSVTSTLLVVVLVMCAGLH